MNEKIMGCKVCSAKPKEGTNNATLPYKVLRTLHESIGIDYKLCKCENCGAPWLWKIERYTDTLGNMPDRLWNNWIPLTEFELAEVNRNFPHKRGSHSLPQLEKYVARRRTLVKGPNGKFYNGQWLGKKIPSTITGKVG